MRYFPAIVLLAFLGTAEAQVFLPPEEIPPPPGGDVSEVPPSAGGGLTLAITPAGYYLLEIDASGKLAPTPITTVVDLSGGTRPPGGGGGGGNPPPPAESAVTVKVRELTKGIADPIGRQSIIYTFETIRKRNDIPAADHPAIIREALNLVLSAVPNGQATWGNWRKAMSDLIQQELQAGRLGTAAAWDTFLADAEKGIATASTQAMAYDEGHEQRVVKVVNGVVDAFKLPKGGE